MSERESYIVVIHTKRLPESFKGPKILRSLLSKLSDAPNGTVGSHWNGMTLEKATSVAEGETTESYVDGNGHLRSSRGVVVRVR